MFVKNLTSKELLFKKDGQALKIKPGVSIVDSLKWSKEDLKKTYGPTILLFFDDDDDTVANEVVENLVEVEVPATTPVDTLVEQTQNVENELGDGTVVAPVVTEGTPKGEGEETPVEGEGETAPVEGGEVTEGEGEETPVEGEGETQPTPAPTEPAPVKETANKPKNTGKGKGQNKAKTAKQQ